jgi:hypothetical protein
VGRENRIRPSKVSSVRSQRDLWNVCQGAPVHSTSMPANFTTLAHLSVSSAISLPKSVGEPGSTGEPNSANRASSLGSANPALISLLSLSSDYTHRPRWIAPAMRDAAGRTAAQAARCKKLPMYKFHGRPISDVQGSSPPRLVGDQKSGLSARGTRLIHAEPAPLVFSAHIPSGQGESPKMCR